MTWLSAPAAASSSSITMTATTASDPSGVEYFFDETSGNPGGSDSGWQNSPTYADTDLSASTAYTYFMGGWPIGILVGVMAFVAGHAFGNGVVGWVILSEIFPTKLRGRAMSIATTSLWVFAFLGNLVFPVMQKAIGNHGASVSGTQGRESETES